MAIRRGFESSGSSAVVQTIVLFFTLFLSLAVFGQPSGCSGQEKERTDEIIIASFNWGLRISNGAPINSNELLMLSQRAMQLSPACRSYLAAVNQRLQVMVQNGQINDTIDRLPF